MTSLNISLSHQTPATLRAAWAGPRRATRAAAVHRSATQGAAGDQAEPWVWPLAVGQVLRLTAAPRDRYLQLRSGRLWLTRSGAGLAGGDVWLLPGQGLCLPRGSDWVVEATETAQACLLEAPQA